MPSKACGSRQVLVAGAGTGQEIGRGSRRACILGKEQGHEGLMSSRDGSFSCRNACGGRPRMPGLSTRWCLILGWWIGQYRCLVLEDVFGRRLWPESPWVGTKSFGTNRGGGSSNLSLSVGRGGVFCIHR